MKIYTPDYYNRFRCIAADCEDSCCKEWEVDVDDAAAQYYRSLPGALGDRLRSVLRDTEDGTLMTIENGRCPMWRQDGLCRIQAELGHEALCDVCRTFPRLRHDYGDFVELGLELSCPEAARLILNSPSVSWKITEAVGGESPEYDADTMAILLRSRQVLMQFLDDPTYTLPQALAVLLLHGYEVQNELDGGETTVFEPDAILADALQYARPQNMDAIFDFFSQLEILTPQWNARLQSSAVAGSWPSAVRSLARYMVGRYYLQAVSDYDLVSRVKFTIIACLLVNALGGDPMETAQMFSKEIENDPDNVNAILDGAYTAPAFTDEVLLGLLLASSN